MDTKVIGLAIFARDFDVAQAMLRHRVRQGGANIATIMDCGGATARHSSRQARHGAPARRFEVGFQIPEAWNFYPPNLTPDRDTGIGKWSEADT